MLADCPSKKEIAEMLMRILQSGVEAHGPFADYSLLSGDPTPNQRDLEIMADRIKSYSIGLGAVAILLQKVKLAPDELVWIYNTLTPLIVGMVAFYEELSKFTQKVQEET